MHATRQRLFAEMRQQPMSIRQFHSEQNVFKDLDHGSFNFKGIFSWHVKISGSESVIKTVCSKWADSEPSLVTTVQPSFRIFTADPPALTMGSIAMVIPGLSL